LHFDRWEQHYGTHDNAICLASGSTLTTLILASMARVIVRFCIQIPVSVREYLKIVTQSASLRCRASVLRHPDIDQS
jgi:hypothetical protein